MRNLERKKGWMYIMQSKPVLIILGFVMLFFIYSLLNFWNKMQDTEKNKNIIENKVDLLKKQKEKITADIENLKTTEGKERIFRENFGLAKEGENVIVVVDDKNALGAPKVAPGGFFSWFKNIFK